VAVPQEANLRLIEQLSRSQVYQDYENAFSRATGLPLALLSVEAWRLAHRGRKGENRFCALMAGHSRSCAACLRVQQQITAKPTASAKSVTCFAGLCDTAVPLRLGQDLIGFLQTGQVQLKKPTRRQFARTARQLLDWGLKVNLKELEEAYFQTRVLNRKQYESLVRLLSIFGQHLSLVCNQIAIQRRNAEPPAITRAKQFISTHQADDLSLADVAHSVNTSTFYFCKMFKKATGLNFTDYLGRVRVEKAKNLLLNPNLRISEIAYDSGFQSLTHFNRIFRRLTGQSPTEYRNHAHKLNASVQ
jgi:AraC-like DNA-binding protein/ligand-binding sensor protein